MVSGLEAGHIFSSSAEVNEWSHTSTPPICFHGVDRDRFIRAPYLNPARMSETTDGFI